ncbi:hypothetical protein [Asticcacaulis sp. YBE204]|uniref:hypothetical protein n=1 Tax=Asticcacaulis sp. YBE204 TaxID=1282363 RepID=UPI0003C3C05D|nr:hypothetical protein [Asticcacaulis sp. YBE204]ESQ79405.1 hypothetical protein AEYBE204_10380 [Asticcacaulis sp. YBE204]
MQKRIEKLIADWETRAMLAIDRNEVERDGSTLRWLREDRSIVSDFEGVYFDIPEAGTRLDLTDAVRALEAAQTSAVA